MNKEKNMKFLGIFLIALFMFSLSGTFVFADIDQTTQRSYQSTRTTNTLQSTAETALVQQALGFAGDLLTKVFGANPLIHGLLVGGISAINTFSKLNKVEIDYALDRDYVNISEDDVDYFTPYDSHLTNNKITQDVIENNMLLTDKNVLDAEFMNTKDLSLIDQGENSPIFRLGENTKLTTIFNSEDEPTDIQKREILFEDPEGTIEHSYEYRTLLMKYPRSTYEENVDYELEFSDLFNNWYSLLIPFSTGTNFIKISRFLDGSNEKLLNTINEDKKTEIVTEQFTLLFNSYVTDTIDDSLELDMVNCLSDNGMILGTTGSEALPSVALDWDFTDSQDTENIAGMQVNTLDWCDADLTGEENKNYIYYDSTQFTIEILNKIKNINDFVQTNKASFTCPTPGVTQSLVSDSENIGLTVLNSNYENNYVNVDYRIDGSFDIENITPEPTSYGDLQLTVYKNNVEVDQTVKKINLVEFEENSLVGEHTFNVGLITDEDTQLRVSAVLIVDSDFSSDSQLDNILENRFTPFSDVCEMDKTSRNLNLYSKNTKIDTSLVEFRSYLMKDGYSDDFKEDFDRYYRHTITAAPTDYKDTYYKYMKSEKLNFISSFDSEPGRLVLQGPGRYNVVLNIEFDDQWNLFDSLGNITGNIEVILTREQAPERDSPVYYMPLDGLVGFDSENARQGYGVDFIGDVVTFDQLETNQYLRTEPFTQSNTINTVSIKEYGSQPNEFSFLNNGDTRGMLLNINLSQTKSNPELYFIPSRATPVGLKVINQANDAYSFYKLDIGGPENQGGEPALTSGTLVPWTGVGECLDFTGVSVLETFNGRPDIHALSSKLAPTTPSQSVAYGVEWESKNITRRGNVFLRTIFYTPSNFKTGTGISVLSQDSFDDDAVFYTLDSKSGSKSVELNNVYGQDIKYISEVYDMVKDKQACMSYSSNNLKVYYNPVAIYNSFFDGDSSTDMQNVWVSRNGECIKN